MNPKRALQDIDYFYQVDSQGMLELLCEFPMQCEYAWMLGESFPVRPLAFREVVFTGMGGSAIGGDLTRSLLEGEIACPIYVNRSYDLPASVGRETLVFAASYSGNTEETLSAYQAARKKGAKVIAVSSGGNLQSAARRDRVPHLLLPSGLPPRTALGYLFFGPYVILRRLLRRALKKDEFREMVRTLNRLRENRIGPGVPFPRNLSKQIASRLFRKIPAVYGSAQRVDTAVTRWRSQLAENAKHLSWSHFYPELNHNEIVGWREPKALLNRLLVVLLRDRGDHPRIQRRMAITKALLRREADVETLEVHASGRGMLSRILSLIYVGDFVSYYLAILNRVDPTPVERIERLKRQLAKP